MDIWEGRTVEDYLELIDGRGVVDEITGAWCWGIDGNGRLIRVPVPVHVNCRCVLIPTQLEAS